MGAHKHSTAIAVCTGTAQEAVADVYLGIMQTQSTYTSKIPR